ncbi:cAMP-binding domain of CRP or a regulatory subunit of cAMP-dependent protein kinases [Chitinophaga eiseniae]|uniref:cAMP-binding domain of CRP or a regulatory subunit of cAMP-dependent protein kinases n=1 Tax=Chitinophaga eiseniae TaxID=634771 RepID=A0A1T4U1W9_9BACT|nr:Crp/Fnr family transcriptional regulator [Chitinophaga eiseniae]SKA46706.1 cAMP-binding domain of CRP or a regulatory subunit of cAMP-dependent protein kinases [Chitinophaga eiseniae]
MTTQQNSDYKALHDQLSRLAVLNESEWLSFCQMLTIKEFDKKDVYQQAGRRCNTVGFVLQGCFRWIKINNGEERTFDFAIENDFVTNYLSIMTGQPSQTEIVAVERSRVACIDAGKLLGIFDSSYNWQKIGRHLAENVACYSMERLIASFYETPEARYNKLMKTSPELFLRVPHHILANYLGMTKETLSRLRNKNR